MPHGSSRMGTAGPSYSYAFVRCLRRQGQSVRVRRPEGARVLENCLLPLSRDSNLVDRRSPRLNEPASRLRALPLPAAHFVTAHDTYRPFTRADKIKL